MCTCVHICVRICACKRVILDVNYVINVVSYLYIQPRQHKSNEVERCAHISMLPVEMLMKIIFFAAVSRSSHKRNNSLDVYRGMAPVCTLWRDVIDSDHFRKKYIKYIAKRELVRHTSFVLSM